MLRYRQFCFIIVGAVLGFVLSWTAFRWGHINFPDFIAELLEAIIRVPSILIALPVLLITNWYLSFPSIIAISCLIWAAIGGIGGAVWYKTENSQSRYGVRVLKVIGTEAILFALAIGGWVVLFILSLPFGVCPFRPGLSSILSPSIHTIAEDSSLIFPPSARLLYSGSSSFQGCMEVTAKIMIDNSDISAFIESLPANCEISRTKKSDIFEVAGKDAPKWWNPDTVKKFVSAYSNNREKGNLKVLISEDNPSYAMIYVSWWNSN